MPRDTDRHRYCVYGIAISSDSPLTLPQHSGGAIGHVDCLQASAPIFEHAIEHAVFDTRSDSWYRHAVMRDGSNYVAWDSIGEFLVAADGRRIVCRRAEGCVDESFQVYMLGQALSFALVQQRCEPLHATVVVVNGRAVAFLGGNAFGKSTLAACFLQAGYRLLTDDLLNLQDAHDGIRAYPGPPRIKLFPKVATRFLGDIAGGVEMNRDSNKLILPLDGDRSCPHPVPLDAIFCLAAPRDAPRRHDVKIETLSARQAFIALVGAAFNRRLTGRQRLERQFGLMARVAERVPVKKLAYARTLDRVEEVRDAVLDHLALS
jgi:hypothetical protein